MAKFKFKMKLQGFELEVEGDKSNVPEIAQAVSQQIAGLIQGPMEAAAEPKSVNEPPTLEGSVVQSTPRPKTKKRSAGARPRTEAIDWRHDPSKWGAPLQSWSNAEKALWLLYVAEQATGTKDMPSGLITTTFNKHFREAKPITDSGKVNRDLGKLKASKDALVGEDTSQTPPAWFLTGLGRKRAEELIAEARPA